MKEQLKRLAADRLVQIAAPLRECSKCHHSRQ